MEVVHQPGSCQKRNDTFKWNLKRVSKRYYLQRCGQSPETTKDDGRYSGVRNSRVQLQPLKEQGEGVVPEPRNREAPWGGPPDEQ